MTYDILAVSGPKPSIYKGPNGHDICQLYKPVEFECVVDGRPLNASFTHTEDDLTQWLYHVQFSDRYKAVFTMDKKSNCFVENGQAAPSPYAKAINEDLLTIYPFNPMYPPFSLSVLAKGETVKVWARREQSGCWAVFFKGDFRFFLHPFTGKWQAKAINLPSSFIIPEIADAVIKKLDTVIRLKVVPAN